MITVKLFRAGFRTVRRFIKVLLFFLLFSFLIQRSTYPLWLDWNAVSAIVRDYQFDYFNWELNALFAKAEETLWGTHAYLPEDTRSGFVRDYMVDLRHLQEVESQIQAVYFDPAVNNPDTLTDGLRVERDALRHSIDGRKTMVEGILEGQVAAVLVNEGFGSFGQLLPPMSMRFTRMPNLLVVSARDEINRDIELALDPMGLEEIVEVEGRIEEELQMAPLVLPLGGMALFPAMIQESSNIPWVVETFSHEWLHHYFFFFPLGLNYFTAAGGGREAMIINETVADTFGKEVREIVLHRYYPEFVVDAAQNGEVVWVALAAQDARVFDFGWTMHVTRVIVDKYMAQIAGYKQKLSMLPPESLEAEYFAEQIKQLIDQSEAFMEQRRQLFYDNGYRIRKLNQAYFAFYGGYQAGDRPGVGGADPIGPAVAEIRAMSPSLHDFVVTMRGITTREELLRIRDAMLVAQNAA